MCGGGERSPSCRVTVTEIDALIETNLLVVGSDSPIQLSTRSKAHAKCETQSPDLNVSLGQWEFTNSFEFLQASFTDTPVGTVVITKNPNLPIHGSHITVGDSAVFPVHSRIRLFLQVSALGLTLVNRDPIVLEADINDWPEVGSVYQATTGEIGFFLQDSAGNPTGSPVAQLYGTHVTIEDSTTLAPADDSDSPDSDP